MTTNLYLRRCFMFQSRQCLLPQNFTIPRIYVIITNHFLVVHLHFCGSLKKKYVKIKLLTRKQNSFHSSTLTTARDSFFEVLWMSFAILTFHLGEHVNRNLYISNQFGFVDKFKRVDVLFAVWSTRIILYESKVQCTLAYHYLCSVECYSCTALSRFVSLWIYR